MSKLSEDLAHKIMALVDEYPSEPFSYERKKNLENLTDIFANFTNEVEEEYQMSFQLGLEEGRNQTEDEYSEKINKLENDIEELHARQEEEKKDSYDEGFTEGFETARAEFNV